MNDVYNEARKTLGQIILFILADLVLFGACSVMAFLYLDQLWLTIAVLVLAAAILVCCVIEVVNKCAKSVYKCKVGDKTLSLYTYIKKYKVKKDSCISVKEHKRYYTAKFKKNRFFSTRLYFYKKIGKSGTTIFTRREVEKLTGKQISQKAKNPPKI